MPDWNTPKMVADLVLAHPERRNATSIGLLEAIRLIQGLGSDRSVLVIREKATFLCRDRPRRGAGELGHLLPAAPFAVPTDAREVRRVPAITMRQFRGACHWWWIWPFVCLRFCNRHAEYKVGYPPIELGLSPALMTPWLVQKLDLQPPERSCFVGAPPRARKQLAWDC